MTIGIYSITHTASGKRYIGKSVNIEHRLWSHKNRLSLPERDAKQTNRHLWNAVRKHGLTAFTFEVVETFEEVDEALIASRELHWMDNFRTCEREFGYNLRRDSSTKMIVHEETRAIMSEVQKGEKNGNFGNYWSDDQKSRMSELSLARHAKSDVYGDAWRQRISFAGVQRWESQELRDDMSAKMPIARRKFRFLQSTKEMDVLRIWESVEEVVERNPGYKWQNIYSVCNGYKHTYMGYRWAKIPMDQIDVFHHWMVVP